MNGLSETLAKETMTEEEKKYVCNQLMVTESQMERLILKYFTEEDYRRVWKRKIGEGVIGGKACGLLAARKLMELYLPEYAGRSSPTIPFLWEPGYSTGIWC